MFNRTLRLLMLWLFVALQTMVPFIHAHAGDVQPSHGGFLHVHQGVYLDAACQTVAAHEHASEVDVSPGVPARKQTPAVPCVALAVAAAKIHAQYSLPSRWPGAGVPDIPLAFADPAHSLPPAFAPPLA